MADNGTARLDRIERALEMLIADHEQFRDEHKRLLTAQVLLQDSLEKLGTRVDTLAAKVDKLVEHDAAQDRAIEANRESIKALDGRVDALVSAIGEWLRSQQRHG